MAKSTTAEKATIPDADFEEFLELLKTTGETVDNLSANQERMLKNRCWTWIQNGKPKAVMPELKEKKDTVLKVYREKRLGVQYIYYRTTEGVQGKEYIKTYGKKEATTEDGKPTGIMIEDRDTVLKTETKFLEKYTKARGEELVETALKTALEPTFYFVQGNKKYSVEAEVFNTDFDEVMKANRTIMSNVIR